MIDFPYLEKAYYRDGIVGACSKNVYPNEYLAWFFACKNEQEKALQSTWGTYTAIVKYITSSLTFLQLRHYSRHCNYRRFDTYYVHTMGIEK